MTTTATRWLRGRLEVLGRIEIRTYLGLAGIERLLQSVDVSVGVGVGKHIGWVEVLKTESAIFDA